MSIKINQKKLLKRRRTHRKIRMISSRPRLVVFRSLKNISAQIINDKKSITLAYATSLSLKKSHSKSSKTAMAAEIGTIIAQAAKKENIKEVVFDRGGYKYHGRVKALADAARKEGLIF